MIFSLTKSLFPEAILVVAASILFLMGTSKAPAVRRMVPRIAILALLLALISQLSSVFNSNGVADPWQSVQISEFTRFIKILSAGIGLLLTCLAWPRNADATEGAAVHFGQECGEFFGLLLLSIAGLFLVAGANDMMLLFMGIELASLPTYIMVSISRPLPVAQEAGVKYFFLGALSAAVMLFGFSYLYGSTGTIYLHGSTDADGTVLSGVDTIIRAAGGVPTTWEILALVLLITALAFKMAAVPLHVYAADVYQGAATPVTALLSYVPKAAGFAAVLKILYAVGGSSWNLPPEIGKLLWWIALLTMTCGNILGLLQHNVKRVLAYSSISHSGYMLVGVAALVSTHSPETQALALRGVLFYLTVYGLTNIAAFGVLGLLPAQQKQPGSSAETFEDLAGLGRKHVALGLAMAVACFSLIGIPLTAGFMGKVLLIQPAYSAGLTLLVVLLMGNSAISAAYYLRIVGALFLRPAPEQEPAAGNMPMPILAAIAFSVVGVLALGTFTPNINRMINRANTASNMEIPAAAPVTVTASTASAR